MLSEIASAYQFYGMHALYSPVEFTTWMQVLDGAVIEHYAPKDDGSKPGGKKPKPKKTKINEPP